MKFGLGISTGREGLFYPIGFSTPKRLLEIVRTAEDLGYYSAWGNDHITTQSYIKQRNEHPNFFEPMMILSYIASRTSKIKLGTGVIIGPTRNPVTLAKQAITLDHASEGRFLLGIGIGAYREEFEAYGGQGNRGEILDELLQGLRLLISKDRASYEGKYFRFKDIEMLPKPMSDPFPIYLGGNSPEVWDRVGKYAQGWLPASMPVARLKESMQKISDAALKYGRDPKKIDIAPEAICTIDRDNEKAKSVFRNSLAYHHLMSLSKSTLKDIKTFNEEELLLRNFVGSPRQVIQRLEECKAIGLEHIWFDFIGNDHDEVVSRMRLFSEEVMPVF